MNKKKLLALSLVLILVATASFGTLAWFNDSDSVTNTFKVATTVDGDPSDPDDIFSVDVWEEVPDGDDDGEEPDKDQDGQEFENILPGATLDKKPVVENTGAYDQYVRVVVTLGDANAWVNILGYGYDLSTIFIDHDEDLWTRVDGSHDSTNDQLVYSYYLNKVLKPGETAVLFDGVKLPTTLTQEDLAKLNGGFDLTIRADAIQTENLGDGVVTAQQAFAVANWGSIANTKPQP